MVLVFTLSQLEQLLKEQKENVIKKLERNTYLYNPKSTEGHTHSIDIDKDKFYEVGRKSDYPTDFLTLKKYIKEE